MKAASVREIRVKEVIAEVEPHADSTSLRYFVYIYHLFHFTKNSYCSCIICSNVTFSKSEFLDRHMAHHRSSSKDGKYDQPDENGNKTCRECGIQYRLNHRNCLAVLQMSKRSKRTPEQQSSHDQMMTELYAACPYKMRKITIPDNDEESSDR